MTFPLLGALRDFLVRGAGLDRLIDRTPAFGPAPTTLDSRNRDDALDITVLIPSFQHERYITGAIQSALAQTSPPRHVLVADDASTDRTVERARGIADPRLVVTVNPTNLGLGGSIVRALERVRTPLVALLNSDDLFHPERLHRCRDVLHRQPAVQVVATDLSWVDARGRAVTAENASRIVDGRRIYDWIHWMERHRASPDEAEPLFFRLLRHNFLLTSSNVVCRTSYLRDHAPALAELKYCLDWHLFLTAAADGTLGYIDEPLLGYRLHASNTVWFTPRTRPAYSGEVNRVGAAAVAAFLSRSSEAPDNGAINALAGALVANADVNARRVVDDHLPSLQPAARGDNLARLAARVAHLLDA